MTRAHRARHDAPEDDDPAVEAAYRRTAVALGRWQATRAAGDRAELATELRQLIRRTTPPACPCTPTEPEDDDDERDDEPDLDER